MEQKEKSRQSIDYIINCVIDEFADKGNSISLNEILQNHNISKGKLYHHFSSKNELLCACVCYCLDNLRQNIDDFQVNNSISVFDNFHNYYSDRINHWRKNPNQLITLRLAYSLRSQIFNEETLKEVHAYREKWRRSKRIKILEILHSNNNTLTIDDESIAQIILLMYETTFQMQEDKMLTAAKNNDEGLTQCYAKELIDYHDTVINTILYGVFKN